MKNKTVLLFPNLYPSYTGGMEIYNTHLAKRLLKESGIILVTTTEVTTDKINKESFIFNAKDGLFVFRRWGLAYLSILVSCLFSHKVKISDWKTVMIPYSSNFNLNAWPVLLFSKLFGFKYVVHCHGGGVKPWKNSSLQIIFFKNALKRAAVSINIINEYRKRTGLDFEHIPPLMPFKTADNVGRLKEKYNIKSGERVILFVGSLKQLKSPETLLQAFVTMKPNNAKLLMVGDGVLRESLQEKYSSNNIVFLGTVPNENVNELYAIADIFVIPSWFEGMSLSLLEAMSNGLCCIGSDVQGINDMIQHNVNGLLFPVNDSEKLSQLLSIILNDETMSNRLRTGAQRYYKDNFDYNIYIERVKSFLSR